MAEATNDSWQRLVAALDRGRMDDIRSAVARLDGGGGELLAQHVGDARVERARRSVRRSRETKRRALGGRVIVIHGIMGARLDVVSGGGNSDRVWVNYLRLVNGRIGDLELVGGARPKEATLSVRVSGIFPEYLPLLLELDQIWTVTPFAYDWRLDLDDAAAKLADLVKAWAAGQPCHIVAHSMGGLVARRMMQLFPAVWASMVDPSDRKRGGRLVQLGTPNRGSFSIPQMLTGAEPLVRKLATFDRKHKLDTLLPILATFPGPYQMMPQRGTGPDDRDRLYSMATWGSMAPVEGYLDLGDRFHDALGTVVDPAAIVYVAGYDQNTPYRIRVKRPGEFEYQFTSNGDGRVPHDLGLLDGTRTLWVKEVHGDLPGNSAVLSGIHGLLETGNTLELEQTLPASRSRAPAGWSDEAPRDASEAELAALAAAAPTRAAGGPPAAVAERAEALLVRGFVGSPSDRAADDEGRAASLAAKSSAKRRPDKPIPIHIRVVCGDITKVAGDVYAVGHYIGVLPQRAEKALDGVVSPPHAPDGVLRTHTRLGLLRGELGDIRFYPWADGSGRLVAVAGMGHPGTFGPAELRKLANKLTLHVATLPNAATICTVLIGSGAGNMHVSTCVRRLLLGVVDALRYERVASKIDTIKIIELDIAKAHEIREAVERFTKDVAPTLDVQLAPHVDIDASAYGDPLLVVPMSLATLALAARPGAGESKSVDKLLRDMPGTNAQNRAALAKLVQDADGARTVEQLAGRLTIAVRERDADDGPQMAPTRFSIVREDDQLVAAALANTAVVPQRVLRFDLSLFDELAMKATDPLAEDAAELGLLVTRLIVPADFLPFITSGSSLIAELDRYTAGLPWELLAIAEALDSPPRPLALDKAFARQLRTGYSAAPAAPVELHSLKVLVIGDPGDPSVGDDLPGARNEAIAVFKLLQALGVEVDARIGAPSAKLRGYTAAGRLEVLKLLLSGRYDIVHYCGHGDFDPKEPEKVGWLFEDGQLTAREIEGIQRAPRLVVANACLSGRVSAQRAKGRVRTADDNGLLPTLADEFFKRGVRDYIGTAWEVNDEGAIAFAHTLYAELLAKRTLGEAMLAARTELYAHTDEYDALWAAYQHYGDPNTTLFDGGVERGDGRAARRRKKPQPKRAPHARKSRRRPAPRRR